MTEIGGAPPEHERGRVARWARSVVGFFDGLGKIVAGLAAVLALGITVVSITNRDDPETGPPRTACADGVDNDGDGRVDFSGNDPSCTSARDPSEHNAACSDGIDNDKDGKTDFKGHDPNCSSPTDGSERDPPCSDGKDNDKDGLVDLDDDDCTSPADRTERLTACADGVDNDKDGRVDLDDPACTSVDDLREK